MDGKKRFRNNIILALLVKGGSLAVGFVTAPVMLDYFGDGHVLGVWYTLVSSLLLLLNFDFGLGSGLRNLLTCHISVGDRAAVESTLAAGLMAYGAMTVAMAVLGILVIPTADWNALLGIPERLVSNRILMMSVGWVFLGILLRFFLLSVAAVLHAMQLTAVNNLLALCASALQLLFLLWVTPGSPEQGLIWLSAGYALLTNLPVGTVGTILVLRLRPFPGKIGGAGPRHILGTSRSFFVCQMAYMVLLNTNELLISAFFGPQYTAEYTFYYKLATLSAMAAAPLLTPVWSAVARAKATGDWLWISGLYRKLKLVGLLGVAAQFGFVWVQQPVMDVWLGGFSVDFVTALIFACFGGAFTYSMIISTLVSGLGRLKLQMACYCAGAAAKLLLVPHMSHWRQVVLCNALALGAYCILQQWDLDRNFRIRKT